MNYISTNVRHQNKDVRVKIVKRIQGNKANWKMNVAFKKLHTYALDLDTYQMSRAINFGLF